MKYRLIAVLALTAWAAPAREPVRGPARVGVGVTETRLTLQQAIDLAAKNNLDVEIERTSVANAGQALKAAQGAFDPVIQLNPSWQSATTPASSILQAADGRLANRSWAATVSLVQPFTHFGTRFTAGFDNSRIDTNSPFNTLNPYYNSRLIVGITQPLVRGFRTDPLRTQVAIRRKEIEVADTGLQLQLINVIGRVEQSYWDLVAARQDVEVKQESVALAQEQLDTNRRLVKAGTLAVVELSAAEAELERRRDDWYTSVAALSTVENRLKTLLAPDIASDLWKDQIIPVESERPSDVPPMMPDLQALVDRALTDRLEVRVLLQRGEIVDDQKKLAADQKKPQVDLFAGYVSTGLAGSMRTGDNPLTASNAALYEQVNRLSLQAGLTPLSPVNMGGLPGELIGDNGTNLSNLLSGRYPTFQVGVSIDLNLRNRTAEANYAQAQIAERQLGLERSKLEQTINQQVRDAVQLLETARQRVTAAEAGLRAAREKLDSETRMFQAGESTNFLVLTRQNEYANSRLRTVVANLDLNRAKAQMEIALGSTLRTFGVSAP